MACGFLFWRIRHIFHRVVKIDTGEVTSENGIVFVPGDPQVNGRFMGIESHVANNLCYLE